LAASAGGPRRSKGASGRRVSATKRRVSWPCTLACAARIHSPRDSLPSLRAVSICRYRDKQAARTHSRTGGSGENRAAGPTGDMAGWIQHVRNEAGRRVERSGDGRNDRPGTEGEDCECRDCRRVDSCGMAPGAPPSLTIVCTRARPAMLARCLDSIRSLRHRRNFELLVINNAPPDNATAEVVRSCSDVRRVVEPRPSLDSRETAAGGRRPGELVAFLRKAGGRAR